MRIGWVEVAIVLIIALIIFGPKRLPMLGKSLGSALRGFKKGVTGQDDSGDTAAPPQPDPAMLASTALANDEAGKADPKDASKAE